MSDQPPSPDDSLSSLFENGSWMFPRVWEGFALVFAATLLPMEAVSILCERALGMESAAAIMQASREGAFGRIAVLGALKVAYALGTLFYSYACLAMAEACARGEALPPSDALRAALSRMPAQLWTTFNFLIRVTPVGLVGGLVMALTFRDSPPTAIFAGVLTGGAYVYFLFRWLFSALVTQFEGLSGGEALRRSSALSGGRFWLVSFQFVVYNAVAAVPSIILAFAITQYMPEWVAGAVSLAIGALVVSPFATGIFLAMYRRETARAVSAEPA